MVLITNLLGLCSLLALFSACGNGAPKYDATGTFETTEVLVSAEASGRLLYFDIEEGMLLKAGEEVGVVDTVQLYLKKLQLEASIKSVEEQRPDILKQVAATKEQISAAQRERNRVANLLKVGAANQNNWMMRKTSLKCSASNLLRRTLPCPTVTRA